MAAHWLRSGLFDGLDATFFRYFGDNGFTFYSVDGNYNVRGDELIFSYLVHIEKKDRKAFERLIDGFEDAAAHTDYISLVRPYLYDNLAMLFDNPERLCAHYVDTWQDFGRIVPLKEEAAHCSRFTNADLAAHWRTVAGSLRRVFYIAR